MRLDILDSGHRRLQTIALRALRLIGRTEPDPVAKLSLYRPGVFGRPWMHLLESVMRGPSEWAEGERELIAAFVSRLNRCPFCVGVHEGTTSLLIGPGLVSALDDWRNSDVEGRLKAIFSFLEKLTVTPDEVSGDDVGPVRAAGVSVDAITDAIYIAFLFGTINRIANAFDFGWKTDTDRMRLAAGLNRIGYHVPEFLLR